MKPRFSKGYRAVYEPEHPRAFKHGNWRGYVYEHVMVAEAMLGRTLWDDEVVHHLDCNRLNNVPSNLIVMLRSQHSKLHTWLSSINMEPYSDGSVGRCSQCGNTVNTSQAKFCSHKCAQLSSRKVDRPTKEVLKEKMKAYSLSEIGRQYNVTDNAVRKWAKKYGIL